MRTFCACSAFIYTTVLAVVFITKYAAASAEYQIYDSNQPEVYTNYRCLVVKSDIEGNTYVTANHADGQPTMMLSMGIIQALLSCMAICAFGNILRPNPKTEEGMKLYGLCKLATCCNGLCL